MCDQIKKTHWTTISDSTMIKLVALSLLFLINHGCATTAPVLVPVKISAVPEQGASLGFLGGAVATLIASRRPDPGAPDLFIAMQRSTGKVAGEVIDCAAAPGFQTTCPEWVMERAKALAPQLMERSLKHGWTPRTLKAIRIERNKVPVGYIFGYECKGESNFMRSMVAFMPNGDPAVLYADEHQRTSKEYGADFYKNGDLIFVPQDWVSVPPRSTSAPGPGGCLATGLLTPEALSPALQTAAQAQGYQAGEPVTVCIESTKVDQALRAE